MLIDKNGKGRRPLEQGCKDSGMARDNPGVFVVTCAVTPAVSTLSSTIRTTPWSSAWIRQWSTAMNSAWSVRKEPIRCTRCAKYICSMAPIDCTHRWKGRAAYSKSLRRHGMQRLFTYGKACVSEPALLWHPFQDTHQV